MIPPAAVIALRALRSIVNEDPADRQLADWQVEANEYLDRLDALLARVQPQEGTLNEFAGLPFKHQGFAGLPERLYPNTLQSYRATARVDPLPQEQDVSCAAACHDCGLHYEQFPLDVVLPDEQWQLIAPEGGVLCAACIVKRAARLIGVIVVRAQLEYL